MRSQMENSTNYQYNCITINHSLLWLCSFDSDCVDSTQHFDFVPTSLCQVTQKDKRIVGCELTPEVLLLASKYNREAEENWKHELILKSKTLIWYHQHFFTSVLSCLLSLQSFLQPKCYSITWQLTTPILLISTVYVMSISTLS